MVKEAAINAEEDKKFMDLVESKNKADHFIHEAKKQVNSPDLDNNLRFELEGAISELENALKNNNKDEIDTKYKNLESKLHNIASKKYSSEQKNEDSKRNEDVNNKENDAIDAEFTEV